MKLLNVDGRGIFRRQCYCEKLVRVLWVHAYHLEPGEGVVSQGPGQEYFVPGFEVEDLYVVVQDDGLLLDEGELADAEEHLRHVVGVAADLERKCVICVIYMIRVKLIICVICCAILSRKELKLSTLQPQTSNFHWIGLVGFAEAVISHEHRFFFCMFGKMFAQT